MSAPAPLPKITIEFDRRELHALITLLEEYQGYVAAEIEGVTIHDELPRRATEHGARTVHRARRCWARAERLVQKLSFALDPFAEFRHSTPPTTMLDTRETQSRDAKDQRAKP